MLFCYGCRGPLLDVLVHAFKMCQKAPCNLAIETNVYHSIVFKSLDAMFLGLLGFVCHIKIYGYNGLKY